MPLRYYFKSAFQKTFDKLPRDQQALVLKTLESLRGYLEGGTAPFGLRVKKLHDGGPVKTFEARVSADLRLVWVHTTDEIVFALLGKHEDVRRFLKNL